MARRLRGGHRFGRLHFASEMRMPAVMAPPPSSTPLTAPARPPAGGPALQAAQALALWHRVLVVGLNRSLPDLTTRQVALFLEVYLAPPPHTVRGPIGRAHVCTPVTN